MRQLLNKLANISRPTYGQDASFGITSPASSVYTNVRVSIQPVSSSVQEFYQQRQIEVTNTVYTDQQLTLRRGDVVTSAGVNYQVLGWRDQAGRGWVLAIDVAEFKQ